MMGAAATPSAFEPEVWMLVFARTSPSWLVRAMAHGRYQHVKAFAYVPPMDAFVFYDMAFNGMGIVLVPNRPAALASYMGPFVRDADLMSFRAIRHPAGRFVPRLMYCVPAIKHLIGLRSGALLPDRLWRDCLAAGGEPLGRTDLSAAGAGPGLGDVAAAVAGAGQ